MKHTIMLCNTCYYVSCFLSAYTGTFKTVLATS